ncbi:hypothetical protein GCM10020331_069500 [Ectobacillus funiculus]
MRRMRSKNTEVDDNAVCILRTDSGIIGTLTASWAYVAGGDNSTVIYGENGVLRLEDDPEYSLIEEYRNGNVVNHKLAKNPNERGRWSDNLTCD